LQLLDQLEEGLARQVPLELEQELLVVMDPQQLVQGLKGEVMAFI